jgi:WD40 repeat protein
MNGIRTASALALALLTAGGAAADDLKEIASLEALSSPLSGLALSPDGKTLAVGNRTPTGAADMRLWDVTTGKEIGPLPGPFNHPAVLAFSPDGRLLATTDSGGRVVVWDVAGRKERAGFTWQADSFADLAFSADGKRLAGGGYRDARLWDVENGKELAAFKLSVPRWGSAFSPDLKTFAFPNYQEVELWDAEAGKSRLVLPEQRGAVRCLAFSADGKALAAASHRQDDDRRWFGEIKLWDPAAGREKATVPGSFHYPVALALSPDAKTLAVLDWEDVDADGRVLRLLDAGTGREFLSRKFDRNTVVSFAFTADGRLLVVAPVDKTVKVWEAALPKEGEK